MAQVRALIPAADPDVIEERKRRGVPVWSHADIICTGETYKAAVKLTFARGAALPDPARLFNASLNGNTRQAIDLHQGGALDEAAFAASIRAAVALSHTKHRYALYHPVEVEGHDPVGGEIDRGAEEAWPAASDDGRAGRRSLIGQWYEIEVEQATTAAGHAGRLDPLAAAQVGQVNDAKVEAAVLVREGGGDQRLATRDLRGSRHPQADGDAAPSASKITISAASRPVASYICPRGRRS